MKATEKMIQAVVEKFPDLEADKAEKIIQTALDADACLSKMEYLHYLTSEGESNKYTHPNIGQ